MGDTDVETRITKDFQKLGYVGTDWIELAQHRDRWRALVNAVMNLRVPQNAGNFRKPVNFSRRTLLHGVSISAIPVLELTLFTHTHKKKISIYIA